MEEKSAENTKSKKELYVVGIGASAGGLEALESFFDNMQGDSGMAFVVVQHLSPDYKSLMVELLSKHTTMKVVRVEDGMDVEPNTVYLIPHKKNMIIFNGKLFLNEQNMTHGLNLPIDIFLKSLADDFEERAIGIILSGTGSDGTRGIRAIKEMGGMVMVQEMTDAKFDGMPRSAISTGIVDYIVEAQKMPEELLKYTKHPYIRNIEEGDKIILQDEDNLTKILGILKNKIGVDFTFYKKSTVVRRIERRISINQIDSIENYVKYLQYNVNEVQTLYKELLIGVTKFFRDTEAFEELETKVIPEIFRNSEKDTPIRVWSVACSTGEEAYSLAILFREYMDRNGIEKSIKIFATDIDKDAVEYAGNGIYPESIAADVPTERLMKYFVKNGNYYQIGKSIREMVIFAQHNIAKDPPFYKTDLIVCRNLLIYLETQLQQKIFSLFQFALNQNGFMFLGASESVGDSYTHFAAINTKWKIYQYKGGIKNSLTQSVGLFDFSRENYQRRNSALRSGRSAGEGELLEGIYKKILFDYIENFVVVDEFGNIINIFGDVNKYLRIPEGRMNFNVLKMAREEISGALGTAIHKAHKDNIRIVYKGINFGNETDNKEINITVIPFSDEKTKSKLIIIMFSNVSGETKQLEDIHEYDLERSTNQRIADLEQELQYTKENLQATVEEIETSNEELQATNEELLSANEELQSTNEELQSVNEELITVNAEYQSKIGELTELTNDINNLLASTGIGTIFLDRNLCIRKFTPAITEEINLIDMDIGRPISHISHNLKDESLVKDAEEVMKNLIPMEKEVQSSNGKWYIMKIRPYRTMENIIKGVVISLVEITDLKEKESEIEMVKEQLEMAMDSGKIAWWIWNVKTGNVDFHRRKAEMLGYTVQEFPKNVYAITELIHPDDYEEAMQAMRNHMEGKSHEYIVDYRIRMKNGGWKWLYDRGNIIERDNDGKPQKVIGVVIDINERKILQADLKIAEDMVKRYKDEVK